MSDQQSHDTVEIESLLATRQQLCGWLEKLDAAGSRAPESVRSKVRADYRARLAQVVTLLGTHAEAIGSRLEGLRAQSREFAQLRQEETEVRAEAELRHGVGEYSDDEWQLVELESSGKIEGFEQELARLAGEVSRLEEVQALIAPPPKPAPAQARVAEPEITVTHGTEIPSMPEPAEAPALSLVREEVAAAPAPRPEAPRFVPRGGAPKGRESGPVRTMPMQQSAQATAAPQDELAFLRSVTLDPAPAAPRSPAASPAEREDKSSQSAAKTLKCGECGSLNRPTEWYCERCGAELAAL